MVVLLQWIGVAGCRWPSSSKVHQKILTFWPHKNRAPNLALAAELATNLRSLQRLWIEPLSLMGLVG